MSDVAPEIVEAPERGHTTEEARAALAAAAANVADGLIEQGVPVEENAPPMPPAPAEAEPAAEAEPPAPEAFELEPAVPEDLLSELDEPDFEAEAEAELAASAAAAPTAEEEPVYGEYEEADPRILEERKARIAAEKRAEHLERLRVQDARKAWAEQARQFFPLSEHALDAIQASSKREFLRKARDEHNRILPYVKRYREQAKNEAERMKEQAVAEGREQAAGAWGVATTGPGTAPAEAAAAAADIQKARESGSLREVFKARIKHGDQI